MEILYRQTEFWEDQPLLRPAVFPCDTHPGFSPSWPHPHPQSASPWSSQLLFSTRGHCKGWLQSSQDAAGSHCSCDWQLTLSLKSVNTQPGRVFFVQVLSATSQETTWFLCHWSHLSVTLGPLLFSSLLGIARPYELPDAPAPATLCWTRLCFYYWSHPPHPAAPKSLVWFFLPKWSITSSLPWRPLGSNFSTLQFYTHFKKNIVSTSQLMSRMYSTH